MGDGLLHVADPDDHVHFLHPEFLGELVVAILEFAQHLGLQRVPVPDVFGVLLAPYEHAVVGLLAREQRRVVHRVLHVDLLQREQ